MIESTPAEETRAAPKYELRVHTAGTRTFEVWQVSSPATPLITKPVRIGRLKGRNLDLVEHRILRALQDEGIRFQVQKKSRTSRVELSEPLAVMLGLLFRTLAPMRSRANIIAVTKGIDTMEMVEAAYWLGMAMHRSHPRRVLMALRCILTPPKKKRNG